MTLQRQTPDQIAYDIVHYSSGPGEMCKKIANAVHEASGLDRSAELEKAIQSAIGSLERNYGHLPASEFPGPPITIIENLKLALRR